MKAFAWKKITSNSTICFSTSIIYICFYYINSYFLIWYFDDKNVYLHKYIRLMEIEIKIDIPKRSMDAIKQYCEMNNLILEEYISNCIVIQNNIDRYGDLNKKYGNDDEVSKVKEKKKEKSNNYTIEYKPKVLETNENSMQEKEEKKEEIDITQLQQKKEVTADIKRKTVRRRTIKSK